MTKTTNNAPSARLRATCARALAAVALTLASASALAIEPFTADYRASYMGMGADGQMKLVRAGDGRWRYSLDISNKLASLSQSTLFEVEDGTWRPLSGTDSSNILVKKSERQANYDWDAGVARWSGDVKDDRAGPVKLRPGDMDALMINLALVRDVAAGKPLHYRMVDNGRVKQLHYTVAGQEPIEVGGQTHQATKVVNTDGDKQTIAWIVEGMPVPARILQRKEGEDALELRVQAVH